MDTTKANDPVAQAAPVASKNFDPADFKGYEVVRPYDETQIEKHAGENGGRRLLKEVPVTTDDNYCFVYLVRRPSRNLLKAIASKKKGDKPDEDAIAKLMEGLILEGDREAMEHDGAIYSELMLQVGKLVKTAKGQIKEV